MSLRSEFDPASCGDRGPLKSKTESSDNSHQNNDKKKEPDSNQGIIPDQDTTQHFRLKGVTRYMRG